MRPTILRSRFSRGLMALSLLLGPAAAVAAPPAAPASDPAAAVSTIREYWSRPDEDRKGGLAYDFTVDVTYADPGWGHVWFQDTTGGVFFATGEQTPAFAFGQRMHVVGRSPFDGGLTLTGAQAEVIGPADTAPLAVPSKGWFAQPERFNDRFVSMEVHVDRQVLADPHHLHLYLSADGQPLYAWLLLPEGEPPPELSHTTVRLEGVFSTLRGTDGRIRAVEIKIQSPRMIQLLHKLEADPAFTAPIEELSSLPGHSREDYVHIVGRVVGQQPGRSLTLRDDTGQIEVHSGQSIPCRIGAMVEAVGYPSISGTEWYLESALFRAYTAPTAREGGAPATGLPVLRLAADVLALSAEQAARAYPVELAGVVTWAHPESPFFFVQDASGGVQILRGPEQTDSYQPGRSVEVRGAVRMGAFAPVVLAGRVRKTGDMPLPRTQSLAVEQVLTGQAEAQYIELQGLVRAAHREPPWLRLELATEAGTWSALLPGSAEPPPLAGAIIRARGVCAADTDAQRRIRGVRLWLHSVDDIQIEEPAPADPFAVPEQALADLGRFGFPQYSAGHRVRLSGVVLALDPGRWVQIQDGEMSLRVLTRDTARFRPGQRLEAVGYLSHKGGRTVLREPICREAGRGKLPPPTAFAGNPARADALNDHLVVVTGRLLNLTREGSGTRLNLMAADGPVPVQTEGALSEDIPAGGRISVTGLLEAIYDDRNHPTGFRLRMRGADDLVLLARPSWFTATRLCAIAAALACAAGLALLWIVQLRRRVQRQTDQIRTQLQRESRLQAELQRTARLESLGLLAGGIAHDFNNLLTIILGRISLASLESPLPREVPEHLQEAGRASLRARELTQQLLTFAKGGSPVRTALALPELVQEVIGFVVRGTAVRSEFDFAPDLRPALVDKGQISQVVQNLAINALQAMPDGGTLRVALACEQIAPDSGLLLPQGCYLRLTVADSGVGIEPDLLPRIFDPYFTTKSTGNGIGLATVHSIVRKHGGHISVESHQGDGTTFRLWLPTCEPPSPPETPPASPPGSAAAPAALSGHILLMDDEPAVRRLAAEMLRHLGLETTTVADGAEALRAYEQAAGEGRPYDLVILDLIIPGGMGGRKTLAELRKLDPQVRAVVSSGYSEDEVMAHHRQHGFCAMVAKPYSTEELARVLRPLLRTPVAP